MAPRDDRSFILEPSLYIFDEVCKFMSPDIYLFSFLEYINITIIAYEYGENYSP